MNQHDIRKGDLVRFCPNLSGEDKQRIGKFARQISRESSMRSYVLKLIEGSAFAKFRVRYSKTTKKEPTDYAMIITKDHVFVPVQSRYLIVTDRKAMHPLTNVFSDFQKNG